jgi:hypothetical protein
MQGSPDRSDKVSEGPWPAGIDPPVGRARPLWGHIGATIGGETARMEGKRRDAKPQVKRHIGLSVLVAKVRQTVLKTVVDSLLVVGSTHRLRASAKVHIRCRRSMRHGMRTRAFSLRIATI